MGYYTLHRDDNGGLSRMFCNAASRLQLLSPPHFYLGEDISSLRYLLASYHGSRLINMQSLFNRTGIEVYETEIDF